MPSSRLVHIQPLAPPPGGADPKTPLVQNFFAVVTMVGDDAPAAPGHPWLPGHLPGAIDPGFGVRPPVDPGYGRPGWSPVDPGYGRPGGPVDPGFGVGGGLHPDHGLPRPPAYPGGGPITPPMYPSGQPLPPGVPPPPTKPVEPGEIWPPLDPGMPVPHLALVWLVGVGYRWVSLGPEVTPVPPGGTPSPMPVPPVPPAATPKR